MRLTGSFKFGNTFVAFLWHRPRKSNYKTMNWFKVAAAQAAAAVNQVEAKLQESGASQKLANVASVANETRSLFSSLTSSLEQSFNKVSGALFIAGC